MHTKFTANALWTEIHGKACLKSDRVYEALSWPYTYSIDYFTR